MKTEKSILIAFILNLAFSVFEFIGGLFTHSIAIISDSIHDIGDAASIGISFFLERKSKKRPNEKYTYGYTRFSVLGSTITTLILLFGSAIVIYNAVARIISPVEINYNGMIIFAIVGVCVNFIAAFFTREGNSLNQKAVNLHMLEDVLGWVVVLLGAIVMSFTNFYIIDPLMSIGVAIFILINAIKNLTQVLAVFLEKTPNDIRICHIKKNICEIDGVLDVHHIHVWSIDGQNNSATMHIVANTSTADIKKAIRHRLKELKIAHVTLEFESEGKHCNERSCDVDFASFSKHHHH